MINSPTKHLPLQSPVPRDGKLGCQLPVGVRFGHDDSVSQRHLRQCADLIDPDGKRGPWVSVELRIRE